MNKIDELVDILKKRESDDDKSRMPFYGFWRSLVW